MDLLFERGKCAGRAAELIAGKTSRYRCIVPGCLYAHTSDILLVEASLWKKGVTYVPSSSTKNAIKVVAGNRHYFETELSRIHKILTEIIIINYYVL